MITLTGMLDLNKEQAPAVVLRIGDTMRQTELTVDNAVDLSECTAELYMVKPDSTFVIAACTITEDNSIIVSWPEQAAAVKGLGEYCIRITSVDPAYVYSARGPVWIDDHVITEDMIESVAEVNGMTFPDDFLTRDDISAIIEIVENIIDDNVTSDSRTWSSDKISNEINNYKPLHVYSTEEKIVGTWIDGSPIFEKTYVSSASDNQNHYIDTAYKYGDIHFVGNQDFNLDATGNGYTTEFPGIGSPTMGTRIFLSPLGIGFSIESYSSLFGVCVVNITIHYIKL